MKICEVCEKSVETVFVSAYGEWLICKPCLISERFAIMREEGEFAFQADPPQKIAHPGSRRLWITFLFIFGFIGVSGFHCQWLVLE